MAGVAFFTCFIVFGVSFSFGAFFKPMAAEFCAASVKFAELRQESGFHFAKGVFKCVIQR